MYSLVLMIPSFTLVLPIFVWFASCICNFYSNLISIHVYPLSHFPSCNLYYGLFLYLGYVCILLVLDKNIHIPRSLFLYEKWIFMFFTCLNKWYLFWSLLFTFMIMLITCWLYTHTLFCLFMTIFHDHFELYGPWVSNFVYLVCFMIHIIWFHVLKDL